MTDAALRLVGAALVVLGLDAGHPAGCGGLRRPPAGDDGRQRRVVLVTA